MNTRVSSLILVTFLAGCGFVKVNGSATPEPAARSEGTTSQASEAEPAAGAAPAPAAKNEKQDKKEKTKGDLQCESTFMGALQHKGAIERTGELHVSTANDGFSAEDLKAAVTSCYKGYGEAPSAEALARVEGVMKEQREAALAAAKTKKLPAAAAGDATAERAIKKDFLDKHPGSDVKRVFMTSGWKTNMDGLVVRNRYKEATVVIGVKGTDICLHVMANAAQASNGGGFESKLGHDVFDSGRVVPCP